VSHTVDAGYFSGISQPHHHVSMWKIYTPPGAVLRLDLISHYFIRSINRITGSLFHSARSVSNCVNPTRACHLPSHVYITFFLPFNFSQPSTILSVCTSTPPIYSLCICARSRLTFCVYLISFIIRFIYTLLPSLLLSCLWLSHRSRHRSVIFIVSKPHLAFV
jgi:hypothetical protein